jgi:hypothetical protein
MPTHPNQIEQTGNRQNDRRRDSYRSPHKNGA